MTISFEIKEIDNGFIVTCFDSEGPADKDVTVYVDAFDLVLDTMAKWFKRLGKNEERRAEK